MLADAEASALHQQLRALPAIVDRHYCDGRLHAGLEALLELLRAVNRYFQARAPWSLAKRLRADHTDAEAAAELAAVLHTTLEALRVAGVLLQPVVPQTAGRLLDALGVAADQRRLEHVACAEHAPPIFAPHPPDAPLVAKLGDR